MIRAYVDSDYDQVKALYQHSEWYGGTFDERRDGREVLINKLARDPQSIIVEEENGQILGTISIIDDGRVAWIYRFVVKDNNFQIAQVLYNSAAGVLKSRGHTEVLVYTDERRQDLNERYQQLGMKKGGDFECFYASL